MVVAHYGTMRVDDRDITVVVATFPPPSFAVVVYRGSRIRMRSPSTNAT
jgi:hypothetical protein